MANIHLKPDVESTQPKPYEQYRRGHKMPCSFLWNIQQYDNPNSRFAEKYDKAFGHKLDEFVGGRNRKKVKECKDKKCKWHSVRKRSGCVQYDDAGKCEESK